MDYILHISVNKHFSESKSFHEHQKKIYAKPFMKQNLIYKINESFKLINFQEKRLSWEVDTRSGIQESLRLLCNPQAHYRIYNSHPGIRISSHTKTVHILTSHSRRSFQYYIPFTPRSLRCRYSDHKNCVLRKNAKMLNLDNTDCKPGSLEFEAEC
jgi:hypothetical protein